MTAIDWAVNTEGGFSLTPYLLSMSITQGREQYIDTYSGGSAVLTFKNDNPYVTFYLTYGEYIRITSTPAGFSQDFYVQNVEYNDYPGNVGLSTVTYTCVDALTLSGRVYADNLVLIQTDTVSQAQTFGNSGGGPLPVNGPFVFGASGFNGSSIASATTYSGTVLNYFNFLSVTERGYIVCRSNGIYFVPRAAVSSYAPIATTFGRETSTTQIAYQQFQRVAANTQMNNVATISPEGLSSVTATNTVSKDAYGPAAYSSSTVDYDTTQATGNAEWIVNNFGDPTTERYSISFSDVAQNSTALTSWFSQCWGTINRTCNLFFEKPMEDLTSISAVVEGFQINVVPGETMFTLKLSPLRYYQFFILNDSVFGVLGGGGIVYNQAEITYDESGWIYNDSNADDTASRLGW